MRASARTPLLALVLFAVVAGCGETNDTKVLVVDTPGTPGAPLATATGARTATPVVTPTPASAATATPTATAEPGDPTPTPTITEIAVGTPTAIATPVGEVDADVRLLADDVLPFLTNTVLLTGGSIDAVVATRVGRVREVAQAARTDDCPDGGSRVDDEAFPAPTLTFTACDVSNQLGSFRFDGEVIVTLSGLAGGSIAFDFTLTDREVSRSVDFLGTLPLAITSEGFELDGSLVVTTPQGTFSLVSESVTINSNRQLIDGEGSITDDADNFAIQAVAFDVIRRGAAANLTATFDDAAVQTYLLDLETGELTFR